MRDEFLNHINTKIIPLCKKLENEGYTRLQVYYSNTNRYYEYFKDDPSTICDEFFFTQMVDKYNSNYLLGDMGRQFLREQDLYVKHDDSDGRWFAERVLNPIVISWGEQPQNIEDLLASDGFDPLRILKDPKSPNHRTLKEFVKNLKAP